MEAAAAPPAPAQSEPDARQEPTEEELALVIDGSDQLSFNVGGKAPTSATLRLTGGKLEVEGQFDKGQVIAVRVEAVVDDIGFKDKTDPKTSQVVGCERRQKARIVGVDLIES